MLSFKLSTSAARNAPRLGNLALSGRHTIQTPHYLAATSRGVVPHLAPDVQASHTQIDGVYIGLEDCWVYKSSIYALS
jgi:queuine tRNA-ribosyltransferase accessory subunit